MNFVKKNLTFTCEHFYVLSITHTCLLIKNVCFTTMQYINLAFYNIYLTHNREENVKVREIIMRNNHIEIIGDLNLNGQIKDMHDKYSF
jgi:hypothetical protein